MPLSNSPRTACVRVLSGGTVVKRIWALRCAKTAGSALAVLVVLTGCGAAGGRGHAAPKATRSVPTRSESTPKPSRSSATPTASRTARPAHHTVPARTKTAATHHTAPTRPAARPTTQRPTPRPTPRPAPRPTPSPTPAATTANNCDPSYPGVCLHDGIGDYDCEGGSGNGPNYVAGPIRVLPPDPFDLDRDGDGTGCES